MKPNYTEITINTDVEAFGVIHNMYSNIKVSLNEADGEVTLSPILQDESNEEAIFITFNKEQCLNLAAILKVYASLI